MPHVAGCAWTLPYRSAIETKGMEIYVRQRCATLRVEPGKIAYGDFLIENAWKITETPTQPQL